MARKRKAAAENLKVQARKMLKTSNEKFAPASIGDTVRVKIPDVDRGRTDSRNVLAVITDVEDEDFYKLANENGTLKQLFTRNQFTLCKEKLRAVENTSSKEISLREAATVNSKSGGQGYGSCHCTKKCTTV